MLPFPWMATILSCCGSCTPFCSLALLVCSLLLRLDSARDPCCWRRRAEARRRSRTGARGVIWKSWVHTGQKGTRGLHAQSYPGSRAGPGSMGSGDGQDAAGLPSKATPLSIPQPPPLSSLTRKEGVREPVRPPGQLPNTEGKATKFRRATGRSFYCEGTPVTGAVGNSAQSWRSVHKNTKRISLDGDSAPLSSVQAAKVTENPQKSASASVSRGTKLLQSFHV